MIYLGWFILSFTAIQFIIAMVNLFTGTHLPRTGVNPPVKISILIPARNEETNIARLLEDITREGYTNIEIIVFDDQSEDATAEIVRNYANIDPRFSLITSTQLPPGWLGKNYACHCLALNATGEYLMFLDADVRISGNLPGDAVSYAISSGSDLVSIFPMQKLSSLGEWITVPVMNFILISLLPLRLVRTSAFPSLAAANGQFMLFRADTYRELLPHEKMKANKVEDILISRYFKSKGKGVSCLLGDERIACRMYSGFSSSVNGFSKNIAEFFGGSYFAAILFWLVTTFGFVVVLMTFPGTVTAVYLTLYVLTRIAVAISGRQSIILNLLLIIPLQLSMGMIIGLSIRNKFSGKYTWKGRRVN